jgi:hypothetical protein
MLIIVVAVLLSLATVAQVGARPTDAPPTETNCKAEAAASGKYEGVQQCTRFASGMEIVVHNKKPKFDNSGTSQSGARLP